MATFCEKKYCVIGFVEAEDKEELIRRLREFGFEDFEVVESKDTDDVLKDELDEELKFLDEIDV